METLYKRIRLGFEDPKITCLKDYTPDEWFMLQERNVKVKKLVDLGLTLYQASNAMAYKEK